MKTWKGYQKGVNLGGWLSQCDDTEETYSTFVVEEDIKTIKGWGMDHVRLPFDYELIEDKDGNPVESGYGHIQDAIDWCGKYGLNMILDLHKTMGYSFDDAHGEAGFFDSEKLQERFYTLWERVAERFGKYEDRLAFELLNEVTDKSYCDLWNKISYECIRRIRKIAPTIRILVGGYWNNSVDSVKDLAMPYDENIIYNFHCYEPLIFTHQGAPWIPTMDTSFRISIEAPYKDMDEAGVKNLSQVTTGFASFSGEDTLSSAYFEKIFAEAIFVAEERDVALYCGEYGVIDRVDPEDVLKWFKLINKVFTNYGIGRSAWNYKVMDFGIADSRMDNVREELLKYL
ncbi:MAG: cellulase family glycosylhydrolase [Clostridiales bacterium]|nr:cellulase family glycosylhydrolase [Clostridiales bacterium]